MVTSSTDGVRERAATFGLDTLGDAEALELILSRSLDRGARTWAAVLLSRWQTLERVITADVDDLASLIGRPAAIDLQLIQQAAVRVAAGSLRARDVLSSWSALERYLRARLAERTREQVRVLFLDKRNQLLADELSGQGTVDHAPVYPREIVRRALQLDASAIIMVHNHPSGDPTPSTADIEMTKQVVSACNALRIAFHDHVLVAGRDVVSFKALGLL